MKIKRMRKIRNRRKRRRRKLRRYDEVIADDANGVAKAKTTLRGVQGWEDRRRGTRNMRARKFERHTSTRMGDIVARFWNLWGGSNRCRQILTKSLARIDISNAGEIRGEIVRLDEHFLLRRAFVHAYKDPRLFDEGTNELIVRIAKCREGLKVDRFLHVIALAPGILLEDFEEARRS